MLSPSDYIFDITGWTWKIREYWLQESKFIMTAGKKQLHKQLLSQCTINKRTAVTDWAPPDTWIRIKKSLRNFSQNTEKIFATTKKHCFHFSFS